MYPAIAKERRIYIFGLLCSFVSNSVGETLSLREANSVLVKSHEESNANRVETLLQFHVS